MIYSNHDHTKQADISEDGKYRYWLERTVNPTCTGTCLFIMLNPSTADHAEDDPTIRRCMDFARRWNFGYLSVVNLFAFRATSPIDMMRAEDPVGANNDDTILTWARVANRIICAWGAKGKFLARDRKVYELLRGLPLEALHVNKDGTPKHPLYVRADAEPACLGVRS